MGAVFLEILHEQLGQVGDLCVETLHTIVPVTGRVQDRGWNTRNSLRHLQSKGWVGLELGLLELARVDGVQNGPGVLQWTTLSALGGRLACPSGIEQPGVGVVLADLVRQLLGVLHWVQHQEWLSETCRESGLWLGDTVLSSGHLGGVSRDEVVHHLGVR
ncbi:hypothetical protein OGAPHI_006198 [Ogataea philodendri]|uniref:Uncharacterized protein n=1 Tax=Ogataea philodendri TaxID=1378263 RepID=A0A9P8NYV7_9ASCO|nr:uncharacterized protein OGAPHI_006198 [Ogataea philodendri]KAH3662017.1 hypothetical protein OGAPHI_006198 [Ogataea philodendri]